MARNTIYCALNNQCKLIRVLEVAYAGHRSVLPTYRGADKSLARPGRKQARKHVRNARDFNNVETRTVIRIVFLQGKAPKEIHVILTEILACFLPGLAKDLSSPLYMEKSVHVE